MWKLFTLFFELIQSKGNDAKMNHKASKWVLAFGHLTVEKMQQSMYSSELFWMKNWLTWGLSWNISDKLLVTKEMKISIMSARDLSHHNMKCNHPNLFT
jgi:hypothetical protein